MHAGKKRFCGLLMAGLIVFQTQAPAETVKGEVLSVEPSTRTLSVEKQVKNGNSETVYMTAAPKLRLKGLSRFEELHPGDQVTVRVRKFRRSGALEAKTIERRSKK